MVDWRREDRRDASSWWSTKKWQFESVGVKEVTYANFKYNKNRYFHAFRETKIPLSLAFFQRQQWFVEFQGHTPIFAAPCG